MERWVSGFASLLGKGEKTVGDAEACLYLYTLSLIAPIDYEHTQIYLYLASSLMEKRGNKVPDEIKVSKLNDWEQSLLKQLKYELYTARGGDIKHPLFDALKQLKKECKRGIKNGTTISTNRTEEPTNNTGRLISNGKSCEGSVCN